MIPQPATSPKPAWRKRSAATVTESIVFHASSDSSCLYYRLWLTLAGLFDAAILPFEVAPLSPFSPASGEKVAVRPDDRVYGKMKFENPPPSPCPLSQFICDQIQPYNDELYSQMNWGRGDIMNKTRNFKNTTSGDLGSISDRSPKVLFGWACLFSPDHQWNRAAR